MYRKIQFRRLPTLSLLLVVILIICAVSTSPVLADCGTPPQSSCITCHAPDGHVEAMGEWNSVHLNQDMCTNCHGGNGNTLDMLLTHKDVAAQPLRDIYTDCHGCHPSDYIARSNQLAAFLHVTPDSCATPTAIPNMNKSAGSGTDQIAASINTSEFIPFWRRMLVVTSGLFALAFFLLGLVWLSSHCAKG